MISAHIRPEVSADFDQWRRLYQEYADFYQVALSDGGVLTTGSWLIEPAHVCTRLVAEQPDGLVGLAHFCGMPSPLHGQMIGFLDDLFVTSVHRSNGTAAALIAAVQAEAKAQGWGVLRWITHDNNYRARGLYDRLAQKTDWALYEMTVK